MVEPQSAMKEKKTLHSLHLMSMLSCYYAHLLFNNIVYADKTLEKIIINKSILKDLRQRSYYGNSVKTFNE